MPSSSPAFIPEVVTVVDQILPRKILDIGFGWGKYGLLMREYLHGKIDNLLIDGIEPFEPYIKEHQRHIYDRIFTTTVEEFSEDMGRYDLILFMDVIEHMDKDKAKDVLNKLLRKSKFIFVSTPNGFFPQDAEFGNERERHVSGWKDEDFYDFNSVQSWGNQVAIMHLLKGYAI